MTKHKPRVVWWSNIPTPYFVERFNTLAGRGNIDFEAWFNEERDPDRSWDIKLSDWRFRGRYIPARSLLGWRQHLPLCELQEVRPDVFVQEYDRPQLAAGSLVARAIASRVAFRVLRPPEWCQRTLWGELGRHFLFRAIDGAKVSGMDGANFARSYGLPLARTFLVTQSINITHYVQARETEPVIRRQRREQLGLHGCVFLYVGRLFSGKGLEYLFEAYRCVVKQQPNISLLLVGDGRDEAYYRTIAQELPGIVFAGFVQANELPEYYALADVFIFPTLGDSHGLVLDEAMAAGLPVISTAVAGNIQSRVSDGRSGYIVPPADGCVLADRMLRLANDEMLRTNFALQTLPLVIDKTHEHYANDFEKFIDALLSVPIRRTPAFLVAHTMGKCILAVGARKNIAPAPYVSGRSLNAT